VLYNNNEKSKRSLLPVAEEMWRREVAMTKCDTRLCVSARNQSLKFTIGVGTPLLTALLIRLRFHLARAQKVPISPRISSFPPSFPKRVSFVPSNESCWKYCSDDPLFVLTWFAIVMEPRTCLILSFCCVRGLPHRPIISHFALRQWQWR
jgi:hypothetical protein